MLAPARPEPDLTVPVTDDVSLAVWRDGPAPLAEGPTPYLLVHGLASNAHLWDGVARHLADAGHPVVSVDLRGHGRSSKPDGGYDVPTVAADLPPLLEALGLLAAGPLVLAGQSYGAIVVLEAARVLGPAVAAVVCVDGGHLDLRSRWPRWEDCLPVLSPPRSAGTPVEVAQGWIQDGHPDWPQEGVAGAFACFEVREDGTVAPWLSFDRHVEVLRGLWEHDVVALRRATAQHTVLVSAVGEHMAEQVAEGDAVPGEDVARAAADLPDGEVVLMVGDHDLHAQHPAQVAALLLGHAVRRTA